MKGIILTSPILRIARLVVLAAAVIGVTGCDKLGLGSGSPTSPTGPPPAGSTIVYSAVGASDVIGFGSSRPCLPFDDCDGTGYVWVAARALRSEGYTVTIANRGIPGAVISRSFQDLGNQNGHEIFANLIEQSAPFVHPDSTLVTVFAGVNDVDTITAALGNGQGSSNPGAYIDAKADAFITDYKSMLTIIRGRVPSAQIVVLNVPNVGGIPALARATLAQKQAAQRASVRITGALNLLPNVRVMDLMCDARFYLPSNFSSDGLHPNDAGYAIIGTELARVITSSTYAAPRSSCAQMTLF